MSNVLNRLSVGLLYPICDTIHICPVKHVILFYSNEVTCV